jgi:hypothetical protein
MDRSEHSIDHKRTVESDQPKGEQQEQDQIAPYKALHAPAFLPADGSFPIGFLCIIIPFKDLQSNSLIHTLFHISSMWELI